MGCGLDGIYRMATTIDESKLDTTIRSLEALIATYDERINKAARCIDTLRKIQRQEGDTANPEDPDTGAVMSDARRQEIYTACIPAAEKMLGLEEAE